MVIRALIIAGAVTALVVTAAPGVAAVHGEAGDAPDVLFGQITNGSGPLLRIHGTIADGADVDMYCVLVADPATFSATVVAGPGFDPQLFLFKGPGCTMPPCPPIGTGIVHDDDTPPGGLNLQSTMTSTLLPTGAIYSLAISAFDRDPISIGGLMWGDDPVNEEYAPNGPGAASPFTGWTDIGESSGEYWILLTGCEACDPEDPQPGTWLEEGDAPDDLAAQPAFGAGPLLRIFGDLSDGNDVDGYRIRITDPATFSAVTSGALNNDTELSLFAAIDGNGVTFNDDDSGAVFSRLSGTSIPFTGLHMLYIAEYERMPAASGSGIWQSLPANVERTPDGPGAPGPLTGWIGTGFDGGYYGIQLTGAEFVSSTGVPWKSPAELELEVQPNPFQSVTTMQYRLTMAGPVSLRVFDLAGRLVRTLIREQQPAGVHAVRWDGCDANGRNAPAGLYTLRLESAGTAPAATRRVVLIR